MFLFGSKDDEAKAKFNNGKKLGDWTVVKKLDDGAFGKVYLVENTSKKGWFAAMKAEPTNVDGGSAIKLELSVMNAIHEDGEKPHVPIVFHAAKRKAYCYMIMTLLGQSLKALQMAQKDEMMSVSSWSRLGVQCLYSIKVLHDYGYVHRDVKPNNFVMGHENDGEKARLVYILDFGLTRSYASKVNGKWIARRARGSAEMRGTIRYCSPNVHQRKEQGRRDDLWSLLYMFIEFHCGLPWRMERETSQIEVKKMNMADADLLQNFPEELHNWLPHLRSLNYYQRPDYSLLHDGLASLMKKFKVKPSDPFDWETETMLKKSISKKPAAWENSVDFFKSDPVMIDGPPPPEAKYPTEKSIDKTRKCKK